MPPTVDDRRARPTSELAADTLGFPLVLKIPDSSFSRGVKKVSSSRGARRRSPTSLAGGDSDLLDRAEIPARPTTTGGSACSAASRCSPCHYLMGKNTGRSSTTRPHGTPRQGGIKTFTLKEAPPPGCRDRR